jgi:anti-anti-sigma factor
MNIIETKKGKVTKLELSGNMTVQNISDCRNEILKYLNNIKDTEVDLSHVEKIDTSGFQLLISVKKEIEKNSKKFKIINPSDDIKRIFNLYQENL